MAGQTAEEKLAAAERREHARRERARSRARKYRARRKAKLEAAEAVLRRGAHAPESNDAPIPAAAPDGDRGRSTEQPAESAGALAGAFKQTKRAEEFALTGGPERFAAAAATVPDAVVVAVPDEPIEPPEPANPATVATVVYGLTSLVGAALDKASEQNAAVAERLSPDLRGAILSGYTELATRVCEKHLGGVALPYQDEIVVVGAAAVSGVYVFGPYGKSAPRVDGSPPAPVRPVAEGGDDDGGDDGAEPSAVDDAALGLSGDLPAHFGVGTVS